jgi:tripartite-type tricarboxylate transporter receptor subunit TctC
MNADERRLKSFKNKCLCLFCVVGVAVVALGVAHAQTYPAKPIRIIVPYPPGGGTDVVARTLAQKMTDVMGQPVLVDNRPGANSIIGSDAVAKAVPDGYTVLITLATHVINPALYAKLPYGPEDHAPVTVLAEYPFVITVHPSLPVKSVKELIVFAKSRPGQLAFASSGNGSGPHLGMELFKNMAGIDVVHVPYKGAGQAMTDLLSGQVPIFLNNFLAGAQMIKAGRLRALAVTGGKRSAASPDVPTVTESGVPGYVVTGWYGMMVPAATPAAIVRTLHEGTVKALKSKEVSGRLSAEAADIVANTPQEFAAFLKAESEKWTAVIRKSKVRLAE